MDLQHKMAEKLALLFLDDKDDEREKAVITYGIEVVLNELLKAILIFLLGVLFGKIWIAIIGLTYLLIIRRYLGGRHFDSNIMCTIFTVFSAFLGPVMIMMIRIPLFIQVVVGIILTLTIIFMNLYTKDEPFPPEKIRINKIISIVLFWTVGIISYIFGGLDYLSAILFIGIIGVVFAFDLKRWKQ